jgi:hypothetical protein
MLVGLFRGALTELHKLAEDLPVPEDDGACRHLPGKEIPDLELSSTAGRKVRLREASQGLTVFFFYPRSGRPGATIPAAWDQVPGARGCTPQSCAYRDHLAGRCPRRQDSRMLSATGKAPKWSRNFPGAVPGRKW